MPYETYGFQGGQQPQQGGPMGTPMVQGQQPMAQAQDPQSQYLAQALAAMAKGSQPAVRSPMALDSNLLASALDQYGQYAQNPANHHVNFTDPTVPLDPNQLPQANLQARQFNPNVIDFGGL